MECEFCHKTFRTIYVLKNHQKTTKSCLILQGKIDKPPNPLECTYCHKTLASKQNAMFHQSICKSKIEHVLQEKEKEMIQIKRIVEETARELKYNMEDELERISSDVRQNRDEMAQELIQKDKEIESLKTRLEAQERVVQKPTTIINNNHLTIYNYLTPERVTEVFDKHYTIETLMGGQKALANFVVDQFVNGMDKMVYLCVDRSRKKCMYTTDFETFHEDVNNEILLSQLTPAMRVIKDKVEWTESERKYNSHVEKIHDSYDEILAIPDDGTIFRSQLCRRLPSRMEDKERLDTVTTALPEFRDLRKTEESQFVERKEEIIRIETRTEDPAVNMVPNNISGVSLGQLDPIRLLYKNQGIFKIHSKVKEAYESDPAIAIAYDDYIKRGTYKGEIIWE